MYTLLRKLRHSQILALLVSSILVVASAAWLLRDTKTAPAKFLGAVSGKNDLVQVSGVIQAARTVPLSIDVAGRLSKVYLPAGSEVKPGQVLATVDWAKEELLYRSTQALLEKMKSAVKVAEAQGAAPEHLSEWQQKIEELEAKQKHIASLIAEKTLVAPFAGVVGTWMAPESAYVNPGQPLVVLRDQSQWLVQYRLPEKYRTQIAVGQDLRVRTRILPEGVAAKVTEIAPDIDPQTQSFSVTAVLAESHAWVPGMHADVAQKLVDPS